MYALYLLLTRSDLVQYSTMEHLANILRALASSKEVNLLAVAKALERHANEGDIVAVAQYCK